MKNHGASQKEKGRHKGEFKSHIWKSGTIRPDIIVDENHKRFLQVLRRLAKAKEIRKTMETDEIKL